MPKPKNNPMDVYNLGCESGCETLLAGEKLFARMNLEMSRKAAHTPVFLVTPDQMDVLSPPELTRGLDPKKVKEWAERQNQQEDNSDEDPLQGLDEQEWEKIFVAAGLYLPQPPSPSKIENVLRYGTPASPNAAEALESLQGPSIYLCCERIGYWASEARVGFELAMAKVLYHELGHAVMDTGPRPRGERFGRIVEESLANWLAVGCFKGSERVAAQRLIQHQPAEYLGYVAVDEEAQFDPDLAYHLSRWMPHPARFAEFFHELRWLLRHGRFVPFPFAVTVGRWNQRLWEASKREGLLTHPHFQRPWKHLARYLLIRGCE